MTIACGKGPCRPARSRSPRADTGHQCWIALGASAAEKFAQTETLERSWFGEWKNSVPVKGTRASAEKAWHYFRQALPADPNPDVGRAWMLMFHLSLEKFHKWIEDDSMVKCRGKAGAYRIYRDLHVPCLDAQYSFEEVAPPREPWQEYSLKELTEKPWLGYAYAA